MKQVFKSADVVFEVPPRRAYWGYDMHKPVLIAIVFPFIRNKPWQLQSTP